MPANIANCVSADWPEPNLVDPVRRFWLTPLTIILEILGTSLICLRVYLRARGQAGRLGWDDVMLIPAWVGVTAFSIMTLLAVGPYHSDRHAWDFGMANIGDFEKLTLLAFLSEIAFLISTCGVKVSILLFFRRLATDNISKFWKWATITAIVATVSYCLAFILVLVFNCSPTEAYWKSLDPAWLMENAHKFHCYDTTALNLVSGILSVVSDFYAVLLPMGMLWNFDVPKRQKIALNALFSLGLFVAAFGAVRTYYLHVLAYTCDMPWIGYEAFAWAVAELQLSIICACAPSLRVFFRKYLSDQVSRVKGSSASRSADTPSRARKILDDDTEAFVSRSSTALASSRLSSMYLKKEGPLISCFEAEPYNPTPELTPSPPGTASRGLKSAEDFEAYVMTELEK